MPLCTVEGCEAAEAGKDFANEGALRMHGNAKHGWDAGVCLECDPPKEFQRLSLHRAKAHKPEPAPGGLPPAEGPPPPVDDVSADVSTPPGGGDFVEQVPGGVTPTPPPPGPAPRKRLRDRVRSSVWGQAADTPGPGTGNGSTYDPPTGPAADKAKPSRAVARINTSDIGTLVWGGLGAGLEKTGIDVPVGRAMKFQAPMAGAILDEWWARTWFDRIILQRIAPRMDDTEKLGALLLLPVLVAVAERSPEGQAFGPLLGQVIQANLVHMAPVVKKQRADAEKLRKALADLEMGFPEGMDPVQGIADMIFAPPPGVPDAEPPGADDGVTATL